MMRLPRFGGIPYGLFHTEGAEAPKRVRRAPKPTSPTTPGFPLGVIRFLDQARPLLIVLEFASGSWLASAEDSHHGSTGFAYPNDIFA